MHGNYGHVFDGFFNFGRYQSGGYIMMILGIILIVAIVYFIFRKSSFDSSGSSDSPMETLQKRYINGEISQEEFLEKKEILGKIR
jgi:putative membrane protein